MSEDPTQELYDEFGNYIGPDLESDTESESSASEASDEESLDPMAMDTGTSEALVIPTDLDTNTAIATDNAIILHEDKVHYPSAAQTYGPTVQTVVLDEDAMDLETPILEPTSVKSVSLEDDLTLRVSDTYLLNLIANPTTETRRCVSVVGALGVGKSTLLDMILEEQRIPPTANTAAKSRVDRLRRYSDTLVMEQDRGLSIKPTPLTLPLPDSRGKTFGMTLIDCPGHVNFHDESVCSLSLSDGVLIAVDALEGITMGTEMVVKAAVGMGLSLGMCITKLDRLILELRLPPVDAYRKLVAIVDGMNVLIQTSSPGGQYPTLCPTKGNVMFASGLHGYSFTLASFAQRYADDERLSDARSKLTLEQFAKKLWGDVYYTSGTFHTKRSSTARTFVEFILEPIYKLYALVLGEEEGLVQKTLRVEGVLLKKEELRNSNPQELLRLTLSKFFGMSVGLVDWMVKHVPSPKVAAKPKILRSYTGSLQSKIAKSMLTCSSASTSPLVVHITKLLSSTDGQSFSAFGRIYSGSIAAGDKVRVLGENYTKEDDEDESFAIVSGVSIPQGRRKIGVGSGSRVGAGNWVLLDGIDGAISKTATLTLADDNSNNNNTSNIDSEEEEPLQIFRPLKFPQAGNESVMKLAVEPLNPAELPKMVEGLRRISKSYPMAQTRVEESGEHVLFGTGEMYLDCIMHDLRNVYSSGTATTTTTTTNRSNSGVEIKVSDPVVAFRETVSESSSLQCYAETPNRKNKLTMVAEPLDDNLAEIFEGGKVDLMGWDNKKVGRYFQQKHDWDLLSARSVWAFGSSPTHGTNILLDDTLPSEVNKSLLNSCRSSIVQGFQWATREGPLCEEPVRSTKLKILNVDLADRPIHRGGGQIIPTARRSVHSSLLTATPRLMEPMYKLQITCSSSGILDAIQPLLVKRRGYILGDSAVAGTPLSIATALLPVIDSFGLETDLRTFTQGQALVSSVFDHWALVPGDPLDKSIVLHPLEPSPPMHLAREFLVKTRRRKGLSEDVNVLNYFEEGMKSRFLMMQKNEEE